MIHNRQYSIIVRKYLLLLVSELELTKKNNCKMIKLIIDATKDKIFFMIINNHNNYYITHENTKKF